METKTIGKEAGKAVKFFELKKRENGKEFYCNKENTPKWIRDMVMEAHDTIAPNDYVYDFIVDALYAFRVCETEEQAQERIEEIEPDMYNAELLAWVSNNLYFAEYVNDAVNEYGIKEFDLFKALQYGQQYQKQQIARVVLEALLAQ